MLRHSSLADPPGICVVNWNVNWATAESSRGRVIATKIAARRPDVVCLTESHSDFFSSGYVVTADADYGYGDQKTRRKVVLWSSSPWTDVDLGEESELPSGRFVAATTSTSIDTIRFVGVCIPWRDAHVRGGHRNRRPWEDHNRFLEGLPNTRGSGHEGQLVMLGDFNQTIPRTRAPKQLSENLTSVLSDFHVATSGDLPGAPGPAIDHVCHSQDLESSMVSILPKKDVDGRRLSDHFGICVRIDSRAE